MSESLPLRTSPREETLNFLRAFARFYQPEMGDFGEKPENFFGTYPTAVC
ncbi:MAG: hypothetical protein IJ722_04990 [Alloprevotella sp.]|nr:hypothetical protein [Alloprevotella sp.]